MKSVRARGAYAAGPAINVAVPPIIGDRKPAGVKVALLDREGFVSVGIPAPARDSTVPSGMKARCRAGTASLSHLRVTGSVLPKAGSMESCASGIR